jgi:hypothetical protein
MNQPMMIDHIHAEIQQILSACDLCVKAIVLLLASSGVRIESIHTMQIGDLIIVDFQYWN